MKGIIRRIPRLAKNLNSSLYTSCMVKSDSTRNSTHKGEQNKDDKKSERVLPPEPTHCCNQGCPNCVWIKYAQELTQLYDDGDVLARNKIKEKVKDQNLRAFLFTQLGLKEDEKRS